MKDCLNKLAGWILASCVTVALAVIVIVVAKYPVARQTYNIELTVKTDSMGCLTSQSRALMDSLVNVVSNQNNILKGKYEALVEHESDNQGLLTIGGLLVTIIVSILGFFGFRSFQSIEEKAIANAQGAAKKKLDDEMGAEIDRVKRALETEIVKRFEEDIKPDVKTEVERSIYETYNADLSAKINFINDKGQEIISLRKDVEGLKKKLSEIQDAGLNENDTTEDESQSENYLDGLMAKIRERKARKDRSNDVKKGGKA